MTLFNQALSYDDVLVVPQYSDIESRSEVSLASELDDNNRFELPIIASPMDTVVETEMALALAEVGALGVVHRYNSIMDQKKMVWDVANAMPNKPVSAAIAITGDFMERAEALCNSGVTILCVDVAHGHHIMMKDALKQLRRDLPDDIHIMAGNVATRKGYEDLADWGAHSVRIGIGGGSICSTRVQTGHGVPTFQSVLDCSESEYAGTIPIIADGGIKTSGDIVKSLGAGADFVMIGSMFSGTTETPGKILQAADGSKMKEYRGMASREAQLAWRGRASSLEGIATFVPFKGKVKYIVDDLVNGIRSGLSYTGSRSIPEFQLNAQFIHQTSAGQVESSTHILGR
jgi:IMP dehydrogenase